MLAVRADGGLDVSGLLATDIAALVLQAELAGVVDVVGIDIPIGLPDTGTRAADRLARKRLGPRRSSIFTAPTRRAVEEKDYAAANRLNRELAGEGMSRQAHGLRAKILDVDGWLSTTPLRAVEVHPELSFVTMMGDGETPLDRKLSFRGSQRRLARLHREGIGLDVDTAGTAAAAGTDDVLDAAAVAWTALRVARGAAGCLPAEPEEFSDRRPAAIWF